ncbi:hypothetical protein HK102_013453 [Quaeritorhiza haematococci]|nr:hypothetical protein HK102_013453 [Quaeritorhiza haematococci]
MNSPPQTSASESNMLESLFVASLKSEPFPTPFLDPDFEPKTRVEREMNTLSGSIRSKPRWREKLGQKDIVDKWRKEAEEQGATQGEIDFGFDELRYYATKFQDLLPMEPSAVDGVWQSDGLVEAELKNRFTDAVTRLLENVSDEKKDWHPGSNNQVLDLVHPSLFCHGKPDEPDPDYDEKYEEWRSRRDTRVIDEPVPAFEPHPDAQPEDVVDLKIRDLQVIVKLANIQFTPENPRYSGGTWHVEGMENERIVASGIYYYSCENITASRLDLTSCYLRACRLSR